MEKKYETPLSFVFVIFPLMFPVFEKSAPITIDNRGKTNPFKFELSAQLQGVYIMHFDHYPPLHPRQL